MRKSIIKVLILVLAFCILNGCDSNNNITSTDEARSDKESNNNFSSSLNKNNFFVLKDTENITYNGQVFFDDFDDIFKGEIQVTSENKFEDNSGKLIRLYIKKNKNLNIPDDRYNIGYFYIQVNKITRLVENKAKPWNLSSKALNDFINNKKIPKDSYVVCQDERIIDSTDSNDEWHYSLSIDNNKREFNILQKKGKNTNKSPWFWETFVWKQDDGLIEYRCGYKVGVNYIWLKKEGETSSIIG